jgi:hypothetical protein
MDGGWRASEGNAPDRGSDYSKLAKMALAFGLASYNRASLSRHTGRYAMTVAVSPTPTFSANLAQGDYLSIHRGRTWEQFKLI